MIPNYEFILILVGCWYFGIPWIQWVRLRIRCQPEIELIDRQMYPLPAAARERLEREEQELAALGFQPVTAYLVLMLEPNCELVQFHFMHEELQIAAVFSATLMGGARGFTLVSMSSAFWSEFRDLKPTHLHTDNERQIQVLNSGPTVAHFQFSHVVNLSRLLKLHQALEKRQFSDTPKEPWIRYESMETYVIEGMQKCRAIVEYWIESGALLRKLDDAQCYFPIFTIYRACWAQWLPFSPVLKWVRYLRARRLERELMAGG